MAWLSQIAERAEALFENLDQATASSMEKAGIATPRKTPSDWESAGRLREEEHPDSTVSFSSGSSLGPSQPVRGGAQAKPTTPTKDRSLPPKSPLAPSKEYDDDSLFEFLNTPSKLQHPAKRVSGRAPSAGGRGRSSKASGRGAGGSAGMAGQLKTHSSPSSTVASVKSVDCAERMAVTSDGTPQQEGEGGVSDTPLEPPPGKADPDASWLASPEEMQRPNSTSHDTSNVSHDTSHGVSRDKLPSEDLQVTTLKVQVSSLELENKLLRREVASLNEEGRESAVRVRNLQDSEWGVAGCEEWGRCCVVGGAVVSGRDCMVSHLILCFVGNAAFQQEAMKGREKVMSLEAELAHHTHQLSDARAALDSQSSEVQVSVWMSLMWLCCLQHPPHSQALQRQLRSVEEELESAKRDSAQALAEKERSVHECSRTIPTFMLTPPPPD